MEKLFAALSDPSRLKVVETLRHRDGLTLGEIEALLPHMSRFGVMKHLKVLEEANLISTRKAGRFKHHYLNPVPFQQIADHFVSRFAAPWTRGMIALKTDLEARNAMAAAKHMMVTIIHTTPEALWEALTKPEITQKYFFGLRISQNLKAGDDLTYKNADGEAWITGKIVEATPPHKLVYTFAGDKLEDGTREPETTVTFDIEQMGPLCKLTLVHDGFPGENQTYRNTGGGWPTILSSLKTLLETGQPLPAAS